MAYLGVVGPYSTGKTTAFDHIVDWLRDREEELPVVVVNCDNNLEREWFGNVLEVSRYENREVWKGTANEKCEEVRYCVKTEHGVWLCETAWADHIRFAGEETAKCDGLAEMIILTCQPDVYEQFLIARCAKRNKKFRDDYWTADRLRYEGSGRFLNAARKYLDPAGVQWWQFEVDAERKVWIDILALIKQRLEELSSKL